MLLIARILSIISPLTAILLFLSLFLPGINYFILSACLLFLTLLTSVWLVKLSGKVQKISGLLFFPAKIFLAMAGFAALLLFLEGPWQKTILAVIFSLGILFAYLKLFKELFTNPFFDFSKQPFNFGYLDVMAIFAGTASLFAWHDFFLPHFWLVLLSAVGLFFLIYLLNQLLVEGSNKQIWVSSLLFALIFGEFFWAILSLPLLYFIKAIILSCLYLMFMVTGGGYYLNKEGDKKMSRRYVILSLIIMLLLLATARWF